MAAPSLGCQAIGSDSNASKEQASDERSGSSFPRDLCPSCPSMAEQKEHWDLDEGSRQAFPSVSQKWRVEMAGGDTKRVSQAS